MHTKFIVPIPAAFAESPQASQPHPRVVYNSQASLVPVPTSLQMRVGHVDIPGDLSPALLHYLQPSDDKKRFIFLQRLKIQFILLILFILCLCYHGIAFHRVVSFLQILQLELGNKVLRDTGTLCSDGVQ